MDEENNSKGIILVLVSMALFSFQDALIKFTFEKAALYEIYFGRVFIASIILGIYLFLKKQKIKFKTEYPFLTAVLLREYPSSIGYEHDVEMESVRNELSYFNL